MDAFSYIDQFVSLTADVIGYIGALFVVIGVFYGVFMTIKNIWNHNQDYFTTIRVFTGQYFLLGLEFLVGKDILHSILDPSLIDLYSLGLLVAIRVILGYFLSQEISDKRKTLKKMFK